MIIHRLASQRRDHDLEELMGVEELKIEALRLNSDARAYLARELLASVDDMSEEEIGKLWLEEAARRDE